ncbi:hypothetical protein L211DRAFT_851111 [Terfezia boudieri ATCC MYA-4762]|uniref:Uncharacterized protein n=1 Tax=Terfezia boudieri ATCC MYA-4762 TaxID=1051890 RepID=A0A3N4LKH6_9PEZI|nr:hypothetical protein L211DRAFT_851111 [Terfezia boudieri ATCC MYA-4762]
MRLEDIGDELQGIEDGNEEEAGDQDRDSEQEQEDEQEDEGDEVSSAVGKKRQNRTMDRYLRATTILGVMINSRNVKVNYFQTILGIALTGYGTPKRTINLMSCLELTISYQTILRTLKLTAKEYAKEVKELAKQVPLGCAYDNLNKEQKAGTETIKNRTSAYKLTVNLVWELVVPAVVATEGQLLRRMCIVEDVNYDELDPLVILGFHLIGGFWERQISGLLSDILWKWCGKEMDVNPIPRKQEWILRKSLH